MTAAGDWTAQRNGAAPGCYAVTVEFELEDGAGNEFSRLVTENARQSVASEPECLRFDVLTPSGDTLSRVFLYEIYTDRAAFDLHLASPHFLRFDEESRPLVRKKTVQSFTVHQNAKP